MKELPFWTVVVRLWLLFLSALSTSALVLDTRFELIPFAALPTGWFIYSSYRGMTAWNERAREREN